MQDRSQTVICLVQSLKCTNPTQLFQLIYYRKEYALAPYCWVGSLWRIGYAFMRIFEGYCYLLVQVQFPPCIDISPLILLNQLVDQMWVVRQRRCFSTDLGSRNTDFLSRVRKHEKKLNLHEKTMHIKPQDINAWTAGQSKKQLSDKIVDASGYDFDIKQYVKKFNEQHKGKINLLDFSNYTTRFNQFKDSTISQKDMQIIRQFQKRKIDQRIHSLQQQRFSKQPRELGAPQSPLAWHREKVQKEEADLDQMEGAFTAQPSARAVNYQYKNWFQIKDDFIMILIEKNTSTKVTTLNRINFFRTLLFMGNGNGLISYGKSRALTPQASMAKAISQCKKNIIAIPLDNTCTLPRHINSRFQDNHVYLRPLAGFNSWGHPVFSMMLALSGIKHAGFKCVHTGKNNYTMLHSFFKAVTQNTTPQDMAQLEGFKRYRHRFIRPLTNQQTHNHLSY